MLLCRHGMMLSCCADMLLTLDHQGAAAVSDLLLQPFASTPCLSCRSNLCRPGSLREIEVDVSELNCLAMSRADGNGSLLCVLAGGFAPSPQCMDTACSKGQAAGKAKLVITFPQHPMRRRRVWLAAINHAILLPLADVGLGCQRVLARSRPLSRTWFSPPTRLCTRPGTASVGAGFAA